MHLILPKVISRYPNFPYLDVTQIRYADAFVQFQFDAPTLPGKTLQDDSPECDFDLTCESLTWLTYPGRAQNKRYLNLISFREVRKPFE